MLVANTEYQSVHVRGVTTFALQPRAVNEHVKTTSQFHTIEQPMSLSRQCFPASWKSIQNLGCVDLGII